MMKEWSECNQQCTGYIHRIHLLLVSFYSLSLKQQKLRSKLEMNISWAKRSLSCTFLYLISKSITRPLIVSEQSWTNSFFLSRYSSSKFLLDSVFISTSFLILVPHFFCVIHQNVLLFTMKFCFLYTLHSKYWYHLGMIIIYVCMYTHILDYILYISWL